MFFEIAQYLSERGFVALQYDKRGVSANFTLLDSNVCWNTTIDALKKDTEEALDVLILQLGINPERVSIVGHSEGTVTAPRVLIDNPGKVDNIVLMGEVAQT